MRRRKITFKYTMPLVLGRDPAANMAFFLLVNQGSIYSHWAGHMLAGDQRLLFGQFLGKGLVEINGETELLEHTKKIAFGLDWDVTFEKHWRELPMMKK
jgi:hypothetical protein